MFTTLKGIGIAAVVFVLSGAATATPLSVNILDHDFTFDVPYTLIQGDLGTDVSGAVYDYNGSSPDVIRLTQNQNPGEGPAGDHNVGQYTYGGTLPQVLPGPGASTPPGASPWAYPLYFTSQFGAKLELMLEFDANDGPYTNPSGDRFDVSLTGSTGFLKITGWIGSQGWPPSILYPDPLPGGGPVDITLLEIEFNATSLLARADYGTADLIEAAGDIKMILGYTPEELVQMGVLEPNDDVTGVTFFKFMLPDTEEDNTLFPDLLGDTYDPLVEYDLNSAYGHISGETGPGYAIPEPATLGLLAMGGLAALRRRRNG